MKRKCVLILILLVCTGTIYHKKLQSSPAIEVKPVAPKADPKPAPKVERPSVDFLDWPVVNTQVSSNLGVVLADIDSHMPAHHQYRFANKVTWAHETTHGINANIRNKFPGKGINGFYVLQNRAVVVNEPKTTIGSVAQNVPPSWKGTCYQLYLVQQRRDWDRLPLYLCDEWVAYTNGAACRKDLKMEDMSSEIEFTCEFTGYVLSLAYTVKQNCSDYDDKQFKAFLMWSMERTMQIYNKEAGATTRLEAIRTSKDGEKIREFARSYFGADWCKEVLGF